MIDAMTVTRLILARCLPLTRPLWLSVGFVVVSIVGLDSMKMYLFLHKPVVLSSRQAARLSPVIPASHRPILELNFSS